MHSSLVRKGLFVIGIMAAALTAPSLAEATPADHAAAPSQGATSPAGTWTWFFKPEGQPGQEVKLVMKSEGGTLTGSISFNSKSGPQTRPIHGKVNGDAIEFGYHFQEKGNVLHYRYVAKLGGDAMSGRVFYPVNRETVSQDWVAKRAK